MAIEVRNVQDAEVADWVDSMSRGFLMQTPEGEAAYRRPGMDLERTWGAFEGGQVVGTLRSFPTPFTVPGPAELPAAALTNVTVASTHRRRGILSEMIGRDLRAAAERGEPVGILIASEYPIYGRFGYGAAADGASYSVDRAHVSFRSPPVGTVELVDPARLRKEAPSIYDRFRASQPGSIERTDRWWDRTLQQVEVPGSQPWNGYQAIYVSPDGQAEGYLRYFANQEWDQMRPKATLTVDELVAVTPDAYARLWRYCCEVDLVSRITAGNRSVSEPLPWLLHNGRAVRQTGRWDFLWVRMLDVPAALSARGYSSEGGVVIDIVDDLDFASGRYALEVGPDGATCTRTDRDADLTMSVGALGSVYLGGVTVSTLAAAGQVSEHGPGALARADALFQSSVTPWCATWF